MSLFELCSWVVQYCIIYWILNMKRSRIWRRSGYGGWINDLSLILFIERNFISIFLSHYINFLKHVHLRVIHGRISMVGRTWVVPLQRGNIFFNQMLLLNFLGGTLHKFRDYLTMRELFCVVVFLTYNAWNTLLTIQLSISSLWIILLIRIFLGFTLIFLLTSCLLR
jgi:hypothetical protein